MDSKIPKLNAHNIFLVSSVSIVLGLLGVSVVSVVSVVLVVSVATLLTSRRKTTKGLSTISSSRTRCPESRASTSTAHRECE